MKPWGLHLYKLKKERRGRRGSKMLVKSDALSGTTSRPSPTLGGTPHWWMPLSLHCLSILWFMNFPFLFKLTIAGSPWPLHFNLRPWGGVDNRDVLVSWYYPIEQLWSSRLLSITRPLLFLLFVRLLALPVRQELPSERDLVAETASKGVHPTQTPLAPGHVY